MASPIVENFFAILKRELSLFTLCCRFGPVVLSTLVDVLLTHFSLRVQIGELMIS